jgi:hypothetical protein
MQRGLRKYGMPMLEHLLDESILANAGYSDRRAIHGAYQAANC